MSGRQPLADRDEVMDRAFCEAILRYRERLVQRGNRPDGPQIVRVVDTEAPLDALLVIWPATAPVPSPEIAAMEHALSLFMAELCEDGDVLEYSREYHA